MSILLDEFTFSYNGLTWTMESEDLTKYTLPKYPLDIIYVDILMPYNCRLKSYNYLTQPRLFNYIKGDMLTDEINKGITRIKNDYGPFTLYDNEGSFIVIQGNTGVEITEMQPSLNVIGDLMLYQMVIFYSMPHNLFRIFQAMLFVIKIEKGNFDWFTKQARKFLSEMKGPIAKKAVENLDKKNLEFTDADQIDLFTELDIVVFSTVDNEVEDIKIPYALLNSMTAARNNKVDFPILSVVRIMNQIVKGNFSLIIPIQYDY